MAGSIIWRDALDGQSFIDCLYPLGRGMSPSACAAGPAALTARASLTGPGTATTGYGTTPPRYAYMYAYFGAASYGSRSRRYESGSRSSEGTTASRLRSSGPYETGTAYGSSETSSRSRSEFDASTGSTGLE